MITIKYQKQKDQIKKIIISGHANYDDLGKDIVCAAVSSIAFTTINILLKLEKNIQYKKEQNKIKIKIIQNDKELDLIIKNLIETLQELRQQYPKNLKIHKEVIK